MRTTISLDDRLARQVRQRAAQEGMSVSAFIARILDDQMKKREEPAATPFRLIAVGKGGTQAGVDLDRPRALLAAEDEEAYVTLPRR